MIYIVEDDASIRELEQYVLESSGLVARSFSTGADFFAACRATLPELVVLDIMLPDQDGLAILRQLRGQESTRAIPVILATAKNEELDTVRGLDCGADDYIAKPFGVMEFAARVKALLRRVELADPAKTAEALVCGQVRMEDDKRLVYAAGTPVELSYKEYGLLKLLLSSPGVVQRREDILAQVWETDFEGESRTLDMHIRTLRQKLGAAGEQIKTVRKVGYKIEEA